MCTNTTTKVFTKAFTGVFTKTTTSLCLTTTGTTTDILTKQHYNANITLLCAESEAINCKMLLLTERRSTDTIGVITKHILIHY